MHIDALKILAQRKEYVVLQALYQRAVAMLHDDSLGVDGGTDTLTRSGTGLRLMNREGYYVALTGNINNFTMECGRVAGLEWCDTLLNQRSLRLF